MSDDTKIAIAIIILGVSVVLGVIKLHDYNGTKSCAKLGEMIELNTIYDHGCYIEVQPNVWIYEGSAKYYLRGGESDE